MRVIYSALRHLPVVTELGTALGHVADLELDAGTHAVTAYLVQSGLRMFGPTFRIGPADVISITAERMVVRDTAIPSEHRLAAKAKPVPAV